MINIPRRKVIARERFFLETYIFITDNLVLLSTAFSIISNLHRIIFIVCVCVYYCRAVCTIVTNINRSQFNINVATCCYMYNTYIHTYVHYILMSFSFCDAHNDHIGKSKKRLTSSSDDAAAMR